MFERYDEQARRAIFFARYEASQSGSKVIGALHMLLGILRESGSLFTQVAAGFSVNDLMAECRRAIPINKKISTSVDMPLSEQCKQALTEATNQADASQSELIRPLHLALGLMSASEEATAILNTRGITAEKLGARPNAAANRPGVSASYPALLEFVCDGERVATAPVTSINSLPKAADEIFISRESQDESYRVLKVRHHFAGPPLGTTLAHCWLVKVVIEVEVLGPPSRTAGDT
jgi:hypothetical protein